jgi:DNA-binding CsgD family transcriptional regulator
MQGQVPADIEERIVIRKSAQLARLLRAIADEVELSELSTDDTPHTLGPPVQIGDRTFSLCLISQSRVDAAWECRKLLSHLTPRQSEILAQLINGHTAKAVASNLGIHSRTVESHINHIYQKTGVRGIVPLMRLVLAQLE